MNEKIKNLEDQIKNLINDWVEDDNALEQQCRKYGLLEEIEKKEEELSRIGAGGSALSIADKAQILGDEIGRLRKIQNSMLEKDLIKEL